MNSFCFLKKFSCSPRVKFLTASLFLILIAAPGKSEETPYNNFVLEAVNVMPVGGGYSTSSKAMNHLRESVSISRDNHLIVDANHAKPSFCSEATYLVFLKTLMLLQQQNTLTLSPEVLEHLGAGNKQDGHGVWGRWNANGPGVASLFQALSLGPNFTKLSEARPGDFLKIFWNDSIGASEHGHLVVYLGTEERNGKTFIHFWSSNMPNGYGKRMVSTAYVHRMIFSRLTNPQGMKNVLTLAEVDPYLSSLTSRSRSLEEAHLHLDPNTCK